MIRAENINFGYGKKQVLENISFEIKKGEIFGVIGPNGSGKTTLMKILSHYLKDYSGKVFLDGVETNKLKRKDFAKKMSVVSQDNQVFFPYTIEDIVLSGRYPYKKRFDDYTQNDLEIAGEMMEQIGIEELRMKTADKISGGEKQLVFIARALAGESDILILDEPTSNLDIRHNADIFRIIKNINKITNKTVIIVSHDINFIMASCSRVMILDKGRNQFTGTPQEIITEKIMEKIYSVPILFGYENGKIKYAIPDINS